MRCLPLGDFAFLVSKGQTTNKITKQKCTVFKMAISDNGEKNKGEGVLGNEGVGR
jgi:hypothetical protein